MVNYALGKVYKIEAVNGEEGDIYIGSTTEKLLSTRMAKHRNNFRCWLNNKCKKTMSYDLFEKYGVENCKIVLLESVNANSNDELKAREAHYIRTIPCVNKIIPLRSQKEYIEVNREKIIELKKEYRKSNEGKKKIKEYYQNNKEKILEKYCCPCGSKCIKGDRVRHEKSIKHQKYINSLPSQSDDQDI